MAKKRNPESCFYCGGLVSERCEHDHFPIPERNGGTDTVPACVSCHDMKDRYTLDDWSTEWLQIVISDLPNMRRETRIFLAKVLAVLSDAKRKMSTDANAA